MQPKKTPRRGKKEDPDFSLEFTDIPQELRQMSYIDVMWYRLSSDQKIAMMKKHTAEFGVTKEELRTFLFTLAITDMEVRDAYAANNGGGSIHKRDGDLFGSVTKVNSDGTISITDIWPIDHGQLVHKDTGIKEPSALAIKKRTISLEDYVIESDLKLLDVDTYTYYTIMQARGKAFKYGDEVVKANTVAHYKTRSLTLLYVAVDLIASNEKNLYESTQFTALDLSQYDADIEEGTLLMRPTFITIRTNIGYERQILQEILHDTVEFHFEKLTGVQLSSGRIYTELHEGYTTISKYTFSSFALWIVGFLKSKRIATGWTNDLQSDTIQIGKNYITVQRDTSLSDRVIDEFNTYLTPYEYNIIARPHEVDGLIYVKMMRT